MTFPWLIIDTVNGVEVSPKTDASGEAPLILMASDKATALATAQRHYGATVTVRSRVEWERMQEEARTEAKRRQKAAQMFRNAYALDAMLREAKSDQRDAFAPASVTDLVRAVTWRHGELETDLREKGAA